MEHLAALLALATGLFVSTNLDDIFVLVGFFSDPTFRPRQVAIGQFAGLAALFAVSVVFSLLALAVAPAWIGLLGVLPILIGMKKLGELRQAGTDDAETEAGPGASRGRGNVLVVAAVTIANGGDNLSIYTPVFATRAGPDVAVIGVVFAVLTLAWLVAAHWLTRHRTLGAPIRRWGGRAVPFVLVALGCWILHEAGTLALLANLWQAR